MKKGRFLWSAHRITERQKAGKARSIKGKQLKNSRNTVLKQLVELLSSQKDNCIFAIINPKVAYGFGDFFTFGSSEQSSCGAAKNSPQDCFFNAATVLKEIIVYLLLSTPKSTYGFGDFFTFGSSEQSSCGAAKNSPQDCFLNAATVLKKIIKFTLLISSEVSTSEFLFATNFVGRILFARHNQILCLYIFNLA